MFFSYQHRVENLICHSAREWIGDLAETVFIGTMAHHKAEFSLLLTRLKATGLPPRAAAVIAAAWLRDRVYKGELQVPMQQMAHMTMLGLRERHQTHWSNRFRTHKATAAVIQKLERALRAEGIADYE